MGQVMGEDAVEVATFATFYQTGCQAQNQVQGGAVVLGHPLPGAGCLPPEAEEAEAVP